MRKLKADFAELDVVIDKGEGDEDVVNKRTNVVRSLRELEKLQSMEVAQKVKIKCAIEGDENSKYYHADLECEVTKDEIKSAVWDCGIDKSPSPDGFTFDFHPRYWKIIESDVVDAVSMFNDISLDPSLYLSHMFYADDAIFVGQWNESNINTIGHILDGFLHASGIRINMSKSKLLGISMDADK
ncbi:hypothetical protein Tco_0915614, partial [Tanacetum coccineum]